MLARICNTVQNDFITVGAYLKGGKQEQEAGMRASYAVFRIIALAALVFSGASALSVIGGFGAAPISSFFSLTCWLYLTLSAYDIMQILNNAESYDKLSKSQKFALNIFGRVKELAKVAAGQKNFEEVGKPYDPIFDGTFFPKQWKALLEFQEKTQSPKK